MQNYNWIQHHLTGLYQCESKEILDTKGVIGLIERLIGQPINSVQDLYKAVSRKQEYVHYAMNELCTCTEIGEGTVDWMEENPLEDIKGMR